LRSPRDLRRQVGRETTGQKKGVSVTEIQHSPMRAGRGAPNVAGTSSVCPSVEPRVYQQLFDRETLAGCRRLSTDTIDRSGHASSAAFASVTSCASRSMTSTPSLSAIGPGAARPDDRRRRLASSRARTAACAEAGRCGSGAPELTRLIAGTDPGRTARDMSLSDPHNKITPVCPRSRLGPVGFAARAARSGRVRTAKR
jgi:hypothetical protein